MLKLKLQCFDEVRCYKVRHHCLGTTHPPPTGWKRRRGCQGGLWEGPGRRRGCQGGMWEGPAARAGAG